MKGGAVVSPGAVAGHCYNHNYGSSGIAVLSDFTKRKINASNVTDKAMLTAMDDLVVYECGRQGLAPTDSSEFLRSDNAWARRQPTTWCTWCGTGRPGRRTASNIQCGGLVRCTASWLSRISRRVTSLCTCARWT